MIYNAILNGGNASNQWNTLTSDEWVYVFDTRSTSSEIRYVKANVNNVNGVILLPDGWNTSFYTLNSPNDPRASYSFNVINAEQWYTLEVNGAVFLPCTGYRNYTSVYNVGHDGLYWSASHLDDRTAYNIAFFESYGGLTSQTYYPRYCGLSIRLVQDAN